MKSILCSASIAVSGAVMFALPCQAAGKKKVPMANPDFTTGASIPAGADHDWNLGATGLRGWMFCDKLTTIDARQIKVTAVAKGSPADGEVAVGDVILGVAGKPFSFDPRTEFGRALTAAESDAGAGKLALTIWRGGKTQEVTVNLPVLGTYSATAPYGCPKSKRILEQGCKALAARMQDAGYPRTQNPITRSLNALALLASGNPEYLPLVQREAGWAAGYSVDGMATWYYGYVITLLAEYQMSTGDSQFQSGMRRLAMEAAKGQSMVGSWGHKFATPEGRLYGYGMMNAPGVPLTISLVMARAAGVKDPEVELAIERSAKLLRFYIGKGAVPYGDHAPWIQTHEDNGKCGMAAILFNLLGEDKGAEYFSHMSLASHGPERDCGHTGNFWNILWSLPAVAQSGPHATGAWMKEFGSWYFDLARRPDGSFVHLGPPEATKDKTAGWDATGGYLIAYAAPLKKIMLTGKRAPTTPQLDAAAAQAIILDGRGWSNKDRNSAYDKLSGDELFERLGSWSPVVRERAAMAMARRGDLSIDRVIALLDSPSLETRHGACAVLIQLKSKAASAVPALQKALKADDLWLRVKAAEALAAIGPAAMPALPDLLRMIAQTPGKDDPRNMQQRFLCFSVFGPMLKSSIDGVDRNLLREAIVAGLRNEDGRARSSIGSVYQMLSFEEIKPLLPAIHQAIVEPSPSGEMFADGIRVAGLNLLAKNRIREGLPLCLDIMDIERWGKANRIKGCLDALELYGAAAKPILPRMRQLEKDLTAHSEAKNLKPHIDRLHRMIASVESATGDVELRGLQ